MVLGLLGFDLDCLFLSCWTYRWCAFAVVNICLQMWCTSYIFLCKQGIIWGLPMEFMIQTFPVIDYIKLITQGITRGNWNISENCALFAKGCQAKYQFLISILKRDRWIKLKKHPLNLIFQWSPDWVVSLIFIGSLSMCKTFKTLSAIPSRISQDPQLFYLRGIFDKSFL